ncbi:MAG: hypothetical protein KIT44_05485 [Opitutaceae bacterium]|nr:hypothetical protein [Opitutaceae bacterium]
MARLPRPWLQKIQGLRLAEYEATLCHWAQQHPDRLRVEKRGESHDGHAVNLIRITDSGVPDADKQIALVTALHAGPERSGATTCLRLVEYLIGDSPQAIETRKKQIVLVMPICNPYALFVADHGWGNKAGIQLYDPPKNAWDLSDPRNIRLADPAKTPELAAVLSVIDEYRPDTHLDLHGTGLQAFTKEQMPERDMLAGQTMFEVSACSYSNCALRPWDWRVTEAMVRAGQVAGYGSDRAEADAQRLHWIEDLEDFRDRLWQPARPGKFRSPFYGYMKYHTMISTTEIGWEESGVVRVMGILGLGNGTWVDENVPGYPVNRLKWRAGRFITAWGDRADRRRDSRVELWQAQGGFSDGIFYPEYAGRLNYVVAVTPAGSAVFDTDPRRFVENLRTLPAVNADAVGKWLAAGPEVRLTVNPALQATSARVQHGIGFRLRVPYPAPEILDVSVNGHSLAENASDGYQAFLADGYTQLQINIPPQKAREMDIFVVTVAYDGRQRRDYGFLPPEAVLRRLEREQEHKGEQ